MSINYDEMPDGPQMDGLVAQLVMGWEVVKGDVQGTEEKRSLFQIYAGKSRHGHAWQFPQPECNRLWYYQWYPWSPSTDIAKAWEVAGKLAADRDNIAVTNVKRENKWQCGISRPTLCEPFVWTAQADTAALAICRAALKAVSP